MMRKNTLAGGAAALALLAIALPAAAQQRTFDVPAQGAASAISAFARQAGLQVVAPADGLEGVRTQALKGAMDARAALRKLIEGTGLEIVSDSNGVIVLRRAATPVSAPAEAEPTALDTIIVTAQKREEAAQGVPISLTAFSGRAVETYRLESLRDISRLTPGLLVSAFSQSSPTIAVRGATNTFTQIGANKPVAVVIDDLFIPAKTTTAAAPCRPRPQVPTATAAPPSSATSRALRATSGALRGGSIGTPRSGRSPPSPAIAGRSRARTIRAPAPATAF